jgi:hypothetical protein
MDNSILSGKGKPGKKTKVINLKSKPSANKSKKPATPAGRSGGTGTSTSTGGATAHHNSGAATGGAVTITMSPSSTATATTTGAGAGKGASKGKGKEAGDARPHVHIIVNSTGKSGDAVDPKLGAKK